MGVLYAKDVSSIYTCKGSANVGKSCQYINGRHGDRQVKPAVLVSLPQEQFDLARVAMDKLKEQHREIERQWEKRLEAEKAARRYYQVEPENRIVARTLEKGWNDKLEEMKHLKSEYNQIRRSPPFTINEKQWHQVEALPEDIPRLWESKTTTNNQRKKLLRLLIEDVTLCNQNEPWCVSVKIHFSSQNSFHPEAGDTAGQDDHRVPKSSDRKGLLKVTRQLFSGMPPIKTAFGALCERFFNLACSHESCLGWSFCEIFINGMMPTRGSDRPDIIFCSRVSSVAGSSQPVLCSANC